MRKKGSFFVFLAVIAMLCFLLCGCGRQEADPLPDEGGDEPLPPPEPQYVYCPLDNAALEELPLRAFAVSIDNSPAARPQSGLVKADIVYEVPAEGGISRYVAVFYHGAADKIGPVRSARPYIVDVAREWNAPLAHCGGSEEALSYMDRERIPHINEIARGSAFWRDSARKAPHSVYTSSENMLAQMEKDGYWTETTLDGFHFDDEAAPAGEACLSCSIYYPSAKNSYEYDAEKGLYLRFIGGEKNCDRETGEQIVAANVLVQRVSSRVLDDAGRLRISMTGSGEALLFSGGCVQTGSWSRDSVTGRTRFTNSAGEEFVLRSGQTWVQVVDQNVKVSYELETTETDGE